MRTECSNANGAPSVEKFASGRPFWRKVIEGFHREDLASATFSNKQGGGAEGGDPAAVGSNPFDCRRGQNTSEPPPGIHQSAADQIRDIAGVMFAVTEFRFDKFGRTFAKSARRGRAMRCDGQQFFCRCIAIWPALDFADLLNRYDACQWRHPVPNGPRQDPVALTNSM